MGLRNVTGIRIHSTNCPIRGLPLGTAQLHASKSPTVKTAGRTHQKPRPGVPWVHRNRVSTRSSFKIFPRKPRPNADPKEEAQNLDPSLLSNPQI